MKKKIFLVVTTIVCSISLVGCTESFRREFKSFKSNVSGGLERTVTVYDYNGEVINSWEGKFDVSASENEVYFDIDGKRVIVHGGIVINEEK